MERQATDWKIILVKHLVKDVYPEYKNKYYNSITRKLIFKWAKELISSLGIN